jgi:outer membrane protein assembly factor BamB
VGNRIFVCSEPTTLVCVNAADGQILWQAANDITDALPPAELARRQAEAADQIQETQTRLDKVQDQLHSVEAQIKQQGQTADLKRDRDKLRRQVRDLEARLNALDPVKLPRTHGVNGYSSPTPTSDGQWVWTIYGNGVAACYDLQGNRRWIRFVDKPTRGWGHSASPVYVDGKLIVHFTDLVALDANTGEQLWRTRSRNKWGSPTATKIGDLPVIITPAGEVIRASDGHKLARNIGDLEYAVPLVEGRNVYFIEKKAVATRLPETADDASIDVQRSWQVRVDGSRHYASSLVYDGLIYALSREEILTVLDAETGDTVYQKTVDLGGRKPNSAYPSIALAGDYLFLGSESGRTIVIKPGRSYEKVAVNDLELYRSTPIFDRTRMYLRGRSKLWCIGSAK